MIRTVRDATYRANSTSTIATMAAATAAPPLLAHERRRALDLDDLDALAGVDDVVLIVGPCGPHLAVDLDDADPFVVGDPLQDDPGAPDQGGGSCARFSRLVEVVPRDRPHDKEQQAGDPH